MQTVCGLTVCGHDVLLREMFPFVFIFKNDRREGEKELDADQS